MPKLITNKTSPLQLIVIVNVFLIVGTIYSHLLVIGAFIKFMNLRTVSNSILVNLSIADLFMIVAFILNILTALSTEPRQILCTVRLMLNLLLDFIVILHLALISVDRFIAVKFALRYPTKVTHRRVVIVTIVVWLWAILVLHAFPITFNMEGAKTIHEFLLSLGSCLSRLNGDKQPFALRSNSVKGYLSFLVVALLVVPLTTVIISYSYVFYSPLS